MDIYRSKMEFDQCYTTKEVSKESLEFIDCMIAENNRIKNSIRRRWF